MVKSLFHFSTIKKNFQSARNNVLELFVAIFSDEEEFSSHRHRGQHRSAATHVHHRHRYDDNDDEEMNDADVNVSRFHQASASTSNVEDASDPRLRRLRAAKTQK